ncbi:zf-HC2 domain-containing protein [Myxococcota bacterium]|nr:zf-HC2 domain-containing protein [Myxococcota bacterium]
MNEFLSCRSLIEFLDDYAEERLSPSERARFDEHLAVCDACVRYLRGYRGTVLALSLTALQDAEVPEDVPREFVRAILAARGAAGASSGRA